MSDPKRIAVWRRINIGRVVVLTVLASLAGFFLWGITADLPPLVSGTLPERLSLIASDIICWPVVLVILGTPEVVAKILVLPAFILTGLFWAVLVELVLARYERNA